METMDEENYNRWQPKKGENIVGVKVLVLWGENGWNNVSFIPNNPNRHESMEAAYLIFVGIRVEKK